MTQITEIYRIEYMKRRFSFVGNIRNERIFKLDDNIFFEIGGELIRGKIVGVLQPLAMNDSYVYTISIPNKLIEKAAGMYAFNDEIEKELGILKLTAERIYNNLEEAKEAAISQMEHLYSVQKRELEYYFKQFENDNPNN